MVSAWRTWVTDKGSDSFTVEKCIGLRMVPMSLCTQIWTLGEKQLPNPLVCSKQAGNRDHYYYHKLTLPFFLPRNLLVQTALSRSTRHSFIRKEPKCHSFHCKLLPPSNSSLKISFLLVIKCKFDVEGYFFFYPA